MRAALALIALGLLLIWSALNAAAVIDGLIALATGPLFDRQSAWIGWLLILLLVTAVVVVIAARHSSRQIERDFPETWKDRS